MAATYSILSVTFALLVSAPPHPTPTPTPKNGCKYCHGKARVSFSSSVHGSVGLTCTGCHGGDSRAMEAQAAHAAAKGFKRPLKGAKINELCDSCHGKVRLMRAYDLPSDQYREYQTGAHARALSAPGKADGATCVDCHGAHDVRRHTDTLSPVYPTQIPQTCGRCHADAAKMKKYGLPADTVAQYRAGVHGRLLIEQKNLKVPTCHDCHGDHGVTAFSSKEVAYVCGHCHRVTRNYFMRGPHFEVFKANKTGACTTCHGNHEIAVPTTAMLTRSGAGGCLASGCHDANNASDPGTRAARRIDAAIRGFEAQIKKVSAHLATARRHGLVVRDAPVYLEQARRVLMRLGPITHTASPGRVLEEIEKGRGYVGQADELVRVSKRAYRDRRIFAGVALALLLLFLVLALIKHRALLRHLAGRP